MSILKATEAKDKTFALNSHKKWYRDKNYLQLLLMASVPALFVFVFSYLPMFGVIIAFKDYKYNLGILGSKWVGFKNFKGFISSNVFMQLVKNTLFCNTLFIVFGTLFAIFIAIMLYEISGRIRTKMFQTIMIIPNFISWVLVAFLVYIFLSPTSGLLNRLIGAFGLEAVDWYSIPKIWPAILTIVFVWKSFGMDSVIYYAALMGIDGSVIEAAEIDGATKSQINRHVVIPSILPLIVILVILKIGNIFRGDFGLFYNVTRDVGILYETVDVLDTYIYRLVREVGNMSISSAAGLMQSVVGFVLVVLTNHVSKRIDPDGGLF